VQKLLTTRGGTIAVGGLAAILAAVVLVVYLNRYRHSVTSSDQPVAVLVAKALIPQGTSGDVVGSTDLFETVKTAKSQVKNGAVTDPAILRGRTAVADIYPGQQLTLADFTTTTSNTIGVRLAGPQRAIELPFDVAHGNLSNIVAGDHIDILGGFNVTTVDQFGRPVGNGGQARPVIKPIMQDILVLSVPVASGNGPGASSNALTLQTDPDQASELAFASDNGIVWVVLRPRTGAPPVEPKIVTLETLLLGIKPITIEKTFVQKVPGAQP
jgi:Flp pilus assembly protein CpaB